jgi:hypothetical protein
VSDTLPPPSGARAEPPVPDEALEALAAGELPAAEAAPLRARVAADPALAGRLARALLVEEALRSLRVEPAPQGVVARVLLGLPRPVPASRRVLLGRFAAAAASFALAALSLAEAAPALAAEAPALRLAEAVAPAAALARRVGSPETLSAVPDVAGLPGAAWAALGAALLAAGPLLARRWRRAPSPGRPS